MTSTTMNGASGSMARSVGAVAAGFVSVFVLSLVVDQVLHVVNVYPPWGQAMHDPALNALALSYRLVITVLGGALTARLAPRHAMKHALVLGVIGTAFATLGAVATMPMNLGPAWYPIALAVTALPTTLLGGKLGAKR